MKTILTICASIGLSLTAMAQSEIKDRGNVNVHFGTVVVYSTYSVGYESFDLLKKSTNHQLRPVLRMGGWSSSILNKNNGSQTAIGITYLFGKKNHFFEHSSELVSHFDRGLKGQPIVYIGSLYRPYLGYRFQPEAKKIILRLGFGWKEVVQAGVGFRL